MSFSNSGVFFLVRTLKFLKLCSLPLCQANKKNYYYYHICVSWIWVLANASTFTTWSWLKEQLELRSLIQQLQCLFAVIIVTERADDLLGYPTLHFYSAFQVLRGLTMVVRNDFVVARFEVWSLVCHTVSHQRRPVPPHSLFSQQDIWFLLWGYSYVNLV